MKAGRRVFGTGARVTRDVCIPYQSPGFGLWLCFLLTFSLGLGGWELKSLGPWHHVGDLDGCPNPWLQTGAALAVAGMCAVSLCVEDLPLCLCVYMYVSFCLCSSAFQISKTNKQTKTLPLVPFYQLTFWSALIPMRQQLNNFLNTGEESSLFYFGNLLHYDY